MKDTITSRGVEFRRPSGDEKSEQGSIVNLVEQIGGSVYVLGTRRAQYCGTCGTRTTDQGTRQTEGVGDLCVYLPPSPRGSGGWMFLWIECKGRGGTLSEAQAKFRELNQAARIQHLVGGLDEFIAYLERGGWVHASRSPERNEYAK